MNGYVANLLARARGAATDITPRPATPYEPVAAPGETRDGMPAPETPGITGSDRRAQHSTAVDRPGRATDHPAEAPRNAPVASPEPDIETPDLLMPVNREASRRDEGATWSPVNAQGDGAVPSPVPETPFTPLKVDRASTESPAADNSDAGPVIGRSSATSAPAPARRNATQSEAATRTAPSHTATESLHTEERGSARPSGTVHVHIGRVEVRAQFAAPAPVRRPVSRSVPTVSLEDYLKTGTGGGS